MLLTDKNGVLFFRFSNFSGFSELGHGIFTRNHGCSDGPFQSLNICAGVGDDIDRVMANRHLVNRLLGGGEPVFLNQVHGCDVAVIKGRDNGLSGIATDKALAGDAVITDIPGLNLVIQLADCQAVLMYDPIRGVVANVHSGWRGSIQNIIGATINIMERKFCTTPGDIIAGIGPSLGPCCAEFVNYRSELPESFWKYSDASNHFNFWAASSDQLCDAGVLKENIRTANICTRCNSDLFFSYRRAKITGRFAAAIGLKQA
ncbi:MAG: multicopper polyphenol oxidase [Desulfobacteraceae bacterium 4572_123]|nr:MAG: multicopper polyphenol oxidase [Desulfobacteraceae bacterium 4572_123]